mmetsp:Transcript_26511/g.32701  ORF Transcript_26511/g.32701 Transcript_26511/m.32701 type:complete len:83 (-) Transcript_26511:243-491(-)
MVSLQLPFVIFPVLVLLVVPVPGRAEIRAMKSNPSFASFVPTKILSNTIRCVIILFQGSKLGNTFENDDDDDDDDEDEVEEI